MSIFFNKFQKRETAALEETGTEQRVCRRGQKVAEAEGERNRNETADIRPNKQVAEAGGTRNRNGAEFMTAGGIAAQRNLPQREATPITVEKIQFGKDFFIPGGIF